MKLDKPRDRYNNHRRYFDNIAYARSCTSHKKNNYDGSWIKPPEYFLLHKENIRSKLIETLDGVLNGNRKIDFLNVSALYPSGFIYFLSYIDYNVLSLKNIIARQSKSITVRQMLNYIKEGYLTGACTNFKNSNNEMISKWRFYSGESATFPEDYDEVEDFIRNHTKSDDDFLLINSAISEAVTNVINHAYSNKNNNKWWMFVGLNEVDNRLAVVISDQGQSIPVTVPIKATDRVKKWFSFEKMSDHDLIRIATIASRTTTGLSYRGKGLKQILDISKSIENSEVHIYSRKGLCCFGTKHDEKNTMDFKTPISGTIISWLLPLGGEN